MPQLLARSLLSSILPREAVPLKSGLNRTTEQITGSAAETAPRPCDGATVKSPEGRGQLLASAVGPKQRAKLRSSVITVHMESALCQAMTRTAIIISPVPGSFSPLPPPPAALCDPFRCLSNSAMSQRSSLPCHGEGQAPIRWLWAGRQLCCTQCVPRKDTQAGARSGPVDRLRVKWIAVAAF